MEFKQNVDLERVYQIFLDKAKVDGNEVVIKRLEPSRKNGCVHIHVVAKYNDILTVYDTFYSAALDEIVDCHPMFFVEKDIRELLKLLS
ncbi:hypothetical protein N4T77_16925 [Clostridium sp. CX1]|uniref:hypothetical protein n=1 Tax=Clostridium sp. CX1 TaxID=2978346 RepID=UPI0021BE5949|nr:hypothetical protein [Clostridium sp. CX1]MCT8978273.1 hypothetical protein [Clostridium sp. CX1]